MSRITWRRKAGPVTGVLLSLAFAAALAGVVTAERWLGLDRDLAVGDTAPITLRQGSSGVIVGRGQTVTAEQALLARTVRAARPASAPLVVAGFAAGLGLTALLLLATLRLNQRGRQLRVQALTLASIVVLAAGVKAMLLLTPLSWLIAPAGAFALLLYGLVDRNAGVAAAVGTAIVLSALAIPIDPSVGIVLGAQGISAVLAMPSRRPKRKAAFLLAGFVGGFGAAAAYAALFFLSGLGAPAEELRYSTRSPLVAAVAGGALSGLLAVLLRPLFERAIGDVPRTKLMELTDLENPLLKKIAADSPGTWQHSLAMANMAEICANAIGANALLVRVGAYYHDLGKSARPQYYIENLAGGHNSPHDQIPPEASAEAIFSHVTEGVRLGRAKGLPEPIIDFMHMHHGDGVLEYFWNKCQEQGNPQGLSIDAFRYPGVKPQSRETAILAICDAVEAGSRSLKSPDARAIEGLVQHIVYGKLNRGQLDEAGLTLGELKVLCDTLVETLKHAHHVRIEYPWQKEAAMDAAVPVAKPPYRRDSINGLPVDGADLPRPRPRAEETEPTRPLRAVTLPVETTQEMASEVIELLRSDPAPLAPGTMVLGPPPVTNPSDETPPPAAQPGEDEGPGPTVTQAVPPQSMPPPRRRRPPPPPGHHKPGE